jgi:membrane peptidoglycan carboxypeptidase
VFYVRQQLEDKYGKEFLKNGGLRIYTTLDPDLQALAESTIETKTAHYSGTYGARNMAMASISPKDGEILAYVGGKDYFDINNDGQVDVLMSRRQPGSSFKPLVYATAFAQGGYAPSTVIFDVETDFGGNYKPQNFDGKFAGPVTAREAINRSLNIPAIKMAYLATPEKVLENIKKVGIQNDSQLIDVGISIGIGAAEVQPLSHINSFQVFARDGSWYEPTSILEIRNSDGKVLEKFDPTRMKHDGLDPQISALVRNILTDETTRPTTDGFDWNKFLQLEGIDNGVKTGTSNRTVPNPSFDPGKPANEETNPRTVYAPGDAWTIGFTPFLVTGVWAGNNRGQPMKIGSTGLAIAAPVWKRFMEDAHTKIKEDLGEEEFAVENVYPDIPLKTVKINKWNGKIATDKTPPELSVDAVFASFALPIELDEPSQTQTTGRYGRPTSSSKIALRSLRPDLENWNQPVQEWLREHPQFTMVNDIEVDPVDRFTTPLRDPAWQGTRDSRPFQLFDRSGRSTGRTSSPTTTAVAKGGVTILTPKDGGNIATGTVTVRAAIQNSQNIQEVEFYFDNYLVTYATQYPWEKRLRIPDSLAPDSTHKIKVVAVDNNFNSQEAEISVKISKDGTGPDIVFLGPVAQQRIPQNSMVNVLADVQDYQSEVKIVEFLLDETSLGYSEKAPYTTQFVPMTIGRHNLTIRAWDVHENVSEKTIPFSVEKELSLRMADPEITNVKDYRASVSVDVVVPAMENFEWIELATESGDFVKRIELPTKVIQFQIPKLYTNKKESILLSGKTFDGEPKPFGTKMITR